MNLITMETFYSEILILLFINIINYNYYHTTFILHITTANYGNCEDNLGIDGRIYVDFASITIAADIQYIYTYRN